PSDRRSISTIIYPPPRVLHAIAVQRLGFAPLFPGSALPPSSTSVPMTTGGFNALPGAREFESVSPQIATQSHLITSSYEKCLTITDNQRCNPDMRSRRG